MKNFKKLLVVFVALTIVIGALVGCGKQEVTMKDRAGNSFIAPKKIERIISTAPSNTEILVGLGLGDKIVGIDKYSSDVPGIKKGIPEIDFRNPDVEAIIALKPDIVIASTHNKEGNEDPFKLIKDAGIPVVYVPTSGGFDGIYEDINFLAKLTGTEEKGTEMLDSMKSEVAKIEAIGKTIKNKKTVYFEIGSEPNLFSFGNNTFLNSMIEMVGAKNIFADEKEWISPSAESVIKKDPDVILTNETYLPNPVKSIEDRPGFNTIKAVKDKQVFVIDKNASSRPSQDSIKALKEIAKAIYPKEYAEIN
ncbi:MAG: ABC transporter substrate-binding protein [Clostridium sp.]|uniref:ABC transporter substrate-binding protein n=1 Tax=Clostridium sp. TaxID=1506 RepID=UPI003EE56FF2